MIQKRIPVVVIGLACSVVLARGASAAPEAGPVGRAVARAAVGEWLRGPSENLAGASGLGAVNQFRGRMIYISGWRFSERLARCVGATANELTVNVGGVEHRLPREEIHRVSIRGDSLANGALSGAAVGFLGGLAQGGAGTAAGGVAIYGGVGAWIDSRRVGRTVIYDAR